MEIATSYDEKRVLNDKLIKLNDEVELLRGSEEHFSCKLQEKIDEIERCEGEFVKFMLEVQAFAINVAVLEDQLLQLVVAYMGVRICALAQEMLRRSYTQKHICI
ncbi:hypothetical protein HPP92_023205 [Vanilla planifolia]|uniref:Uncharacterized protein n=1 Tax=Vanilla planifolia TaxID=51239 RepID=A0A835Q250_VANPL|nr:hypothetical protein HPP92_023205 [Vanilla planifolia]